MSSTSSEETYDTEAIASRVMYELLGRRWVWPILRATDAYPLHREIVLTGRPVKTVERIVTDLEVEVTDWELYSGFRLRLPFMTRTRSFCSDNEVYVTYTYGSEPPEQVLYAIHVLSEQLDLAVSGSEDCKLPERVTSISRQGMSMTILDPMDYLSKGRTGISEVDAAITLFNPSGARARARFFTQRNPPARRISVEQADSTTTLTIQQGSDWSATWPVLDAAGAPQSLVGWTAHAEARPRAGSPTLLFDWSADDANLEIVGSSVVLRVPAAVSSGWSWQTAAFDLEVTDPDGATTRIDSGHIFVDPEVTT